MKNIPRVFIDSKLQEGASVSLTREQHHYLTKVMRTDRFLAFGGGEEFEATVTGVAAAKIIKNTGRLDPSGGWIFCFAPIKKTEDLISAIVQMGAGVLHPVITERTTARHINWARMRKIIIENAEQSGRNSIPELRPPIAFKDLQKKGVVFGDERKCGVWSVKCGVGNRKDSSAVKNDLLIVETNANSTLHTSHFTLMIGPEGGFSDAEFDALDDAGAIGVGLGATILRAEVAAVALAAKVIGG